MAKKRRRLKEAKAEKAARRRKARRKKRVLVLVLEIIIFLILLACGYIMSKYEKLRADGFDDSNIFMNEEMLQKGYTTIALFGGDSREGQLGAGTRADTMMIVAIDNKTKEVKIVSVYRDTPMRQENGTIRKANHAYFAGGPQEAISMLNRNLDLGIQDYVTVDFKAMAEVIDLLGGLEIEITEKEANEMNKFIGETARVADKEAEPVEEGLQTLDGVQAVTYARIRKNVGGDYARTERQRLVVEKIVEKVKQTNLFTINEIIDKAFSQISTSFTLSELIKLASGVTRYNIGETSGFPFEKTDGYIEGIGSVVIPLGFVENVEELHEFLYPKEEYVATKTIQNIAADIEYLSGYTRADYENP